MYFQAGHKLHALLKVKIASKFWDSPQEMGQ